MFAICYTPLFQQENKSRKKTFLFFPLILLFVRWVRVHSDRNESMRLHLQFCLWRTWVHLESLDCFAFGRSGQFSAVQGICHSCGEMRCFRISGSGGLHIYLMKAVGKVRSWMLKSERVWVLSKKRALQWSYSVGNTLNCWLCSNSWCLAGSHSGSRACLGVLYCLIKKRSMAKRGKASSAFLQQFTGALLVLQETPNC